MRMTSERGSCISKSSTAGYAVGEQWARLANNGSGSNHHGLSSAIHEKAPRASFTRGFPRPSLFDSVLTLTFSRLRVCIMSVMLLDTASSPSPANSTFAVPRQRARDGSDAKPTHATPHCQHDHLHYTMTRYVGALGL